MRDVSEGGAQLEVAYPQWLPSRFRLMIELSGFEADCEIVRRMENAVGVRFLTPVSINAWGGEPIDGAP
jgi:PilZ domain-containing protein